MVTIFLHQQLLRTCGFIGGFSANGTRAEIRNLVKRLHQGGSGVQRGERTGRRPRAFRTGGHPKSEIAKIKC